MEFEYFAEDLDEKQRLEFMFYAFKKAYDLKRRGYCYATTMGVQMLMECMGDMVMGWKTPKHDKETWKVEPFFSPLMLVELERKIEDLTGKQKTEFPSTPHKSSIPSKSSQNR